MEIRHRDLRMMVGSINEGYEAQSSRSRERCVMILGWQTTDSLASDLQIKINHEVVYRSRALLMTGSLPSEHEPIFFATKTKKSVNTLHGLMVRSHAPLGDQALECLGGHVERLIV